MENPRVLDIRLLDNPDGALPAGRDGRLARFLGEIVAAASLLPAGEFQVSSLGCRRRPNHRPCPGKIRLGREVESDQIHWSCVACRDSGVITNWQRSRWDLQAELQGGRIVSLSAERARRQSRLAPLVRLQCYDLAIELVHAPFLLEDRVMRQIQLTGDCTLQDLHACLQAAFDRRDEQPYEFMFGPPYDPDTRRFSGPGCASDGGEGFWDTRLIRVDTLGLRPGDTFGYLYDFSDEWVHRISVLSMREASCSTSPRVLSRVGDSPVWPPEPEQRPAWRELESTCPMSSLYGPYRAEDAPEPDDWLALDELERQLLVMESHTRELPPEHSRSASQLLHALLHSIAETHLAERAGDCSVDDLRCARPEQRHGVIHTLGARLIHEQLDASREPLVPVSRARKLGHRKIKDPE